MKFSIKDFFSKCDQIRRKLLIWSHLLKKSIMENFVFRSVLVNQGSVLGTLVFNIVLGTLSLYHKQQSMQWCWSNTWRSINNTFYKAILNLEVNCATIQICKNGCLRIACLSILGNDQLHKNNIIAGKITSSNNKNLLTSSVMKN